MVLLSNPPFDFHRLLQSLSQILEVAYDFEVSLPDGKLKSICFALHTQVKKAVLHFIKTLLNVQGLDEWAWDLVAYIFKQSSLSGSQMKSKNHSSQDAEEEQSIRATCVEILEHLDVSISVMSQVLWPRLLEYIVPAQYSCTLTPLCRCLGDLAEQPQWEGEEVAWMDPSKEDQSRTMGAAEEELRGLREGLKRASPEAVLTSSCQMAKVPDILSTIFIRMPTMQERSMRGFLLEGVGILAVFHLEAVISSLLAKPLPMDRLSMETLACAISKGLGERVAADLSEAGTWPLLESPQTHHEGVCQLARALLPLGIITPQFIGQVLKWASSPTENLRVTGTAFISQVMCDPVIEEQKLLKAVLYLLQQQARDTNNLVRQMSARGLGNITLSRAERLKKHQKAVVETLFQASFVPARAEIVEEGVRALTRIFKHLGMDAGPLVQDAAMHIRPFFNHDNDGLRAVAFSLFGALAGCMKRRQAFYKRQVRQSLGTLLLHLEDPNPQVAKVRTGDTDFLSPARFP
ncbi:maestro heat-like repeat-containing protein family member 2B [Alligator sinensis]|uniref:Maestro heat-like repeat-containing protein family member 2B n=1 Tax=Alligator sinensis TaxID=38654 RepID=A0A3Q0H770_ALLSI|nr:maestro heat-like repeat-containing protein family member 2B [Alligator sinensis]